MARTRAIIVALLLMCVSLSAKGDPLKLLARRLRPKPPAIARSRIDQDFAVLLMRSSYTAAEEMRFVPMDEFQRAFFLNRQDEWQPYLAAVEGLVPKQGDLQDPSYFDFISFAQYSTLAEEMRNGRLAYRELVGAEGEQVVRERPADVPRDNAALPAEHRRRVGDVIFSWASERYDIAPARAPDEIAARARELLEVFRIRGFVASTAVQLAQNRDGSATLTCAVGAPATLWSQRVLEGTALRNDFEAMAVNALVRQAGATLLSQRTSFSPLDVRHAITFSAPGREAPAAR